MNPCAVCETPLEGDSSTVGVNGSFMHVRCFAAGLKKLLPTKPFKDFEIDVNGIDANTAYRLGQQSMGTLLAARRKAKRGSR